MEMIYVYLEKEPILVTSELLLKLCRNCLLRTLLNQRMISALLDSLFGSSQESLTFEIEIQRCGV